MKLIKPKTKNRLAALLALSCTPAFAQTFDATRIDGRPTGHAFDSGGFDPIIDTSTFSSIGLGGSESGNINGPSMVRLPDWLSTEDRVAPNANYYLYFAHHAGDSIRMAWASSLTGDWNLFNYGSNIDRAWGVAGSNTGAQTLGNGVLDLDINNSEYMAFDGPGGFAANSHIASPDVFIDEVNQRFVMYFHAPNAGVGPSGQQTFVTTSSTGLNFNTLADGGQAGEGPRDVIPSHFYSKAFTVSGQTFAYSNEGLLWQAPLTNDAGELNTLANADTEGGLWNPSGAINAGAHHWDQIGTADNPIQSLYLDNDQGAKDARHFAIYQRDHLDPSDTNLYVFYTARYDAPESIFLTVIDTDNGSTDTADWVAIGQRVILEPQLDWEGIDRPLGTSANGSQTNVRQLRDPGIFEDDMGTPSTADDKVYLLYTGEGEEAIGLAELNFDALLSNLAGPQGDLGLTGTEPEPSGGHVYVDFNGMVGPTQSGFTAAYPDVSYQNDEGAAAVVFDNPFGTGDVAVSLTANRWKERNAINDSSPADELEDLLIDFGGPEVGQIAELELELPEGSYLVELFQHESQRNSPETALLTIEDADGTTTGIQLVSGFGTNPDAVVMSSFLVSSNGLHAVMFIIDNTDSATTGAYPINGLIIRLPGDTDGDGDIDDADLGAAFANYTGPLTPGTGGKSGADGDTDADGDVDDADLGVAFAKYTGPLAASVVPEPASAALLVLPGLLVFRRRRAATNSRLSATTDAFKF